VKTAAAHVILAREDRLTSADPASEPQAIGAIVKVLHAPIVKANGIGL